MSDDTTMSSDTVGPALGIAFILGLHTWRLWHSYRHGELLTDDSGREPQAATCGDIALSLALMLALGAYGAYGAMQICTWTGRYLRCE